MIQWLKNAAIFTFPALAVLFASLADGVDPRASWGLAAVVLYGLLADLFRKYSSSK
jgi:hypothetical protein